MAKIIRSADDIDPTDKIELTVESSDGKSVKTCQSMVLDVTDEGVVISIPTANKVPVPLAKGTKVEASIWKHYAEHRFKTKVLARRKLKIPQLILEKPAAEAIDRTPLRKNYRVETRTPVEVRLHRMKQQDPMMGSTLDLSAGGCALQLPLAFKVGTELELEFSLPYPPDEEGLPRTIRLSKILGTVLSVTAPSQLNSHVRVMGISFVDLDKSVQNDLLRYVTFRQRELIRKREEGRGGTAEVPYYSAKSRMTGNRGQNKAASTSAGSAPTQATGSKNKPKTERETSKNTSTKPVNASQNKKETPSKNVSTPQNQAQSIPASPPAQETTSTKSNTPEQTPKPDTENKLTDQTTTDTPTPPEETEALNEQALQETQEQTKRITQQIPGLQEFIDTEISANDETSEHKDTLENDETSANKDTLETTEEAKTDDSPPSKETTPEPEKETPEPSIAATPIVYDNERFGPLKVIMPEDNTYNGKTVLVVDDDEGIRAVISDILILNKYRVIEAENGQEGFDIASNVHVDLVITDLMMPEVNGWRLLALLKQHKIEVPVVIITGFMSKEGREVLTNKEIAGFLVKPIRLEELLTLVRRILFPEETSRKYRVLTVEDDDDTRMLIAAQLEKAGFAVAEAADGIEALNQIDTFQPDLVLLDIMMPRMDGFEVAKYLRARSATAEIPIFMLTVKTSPDYVRRAVAMKIEGYIIKPFDAKNLSQRIVNVLRSTEGNTPLQKGV